MAHAAKNTRVRQYRHWRRQEKKVSVIDKVLGHVAGKSRTRHKNSGNSKFDTAAPCELRNLTRERFFCTGCGEKKDNISRLRHISAAFFYWNSHFDCSCVLCCRVYCAVLCFVVLCCLVCLVLSCLLLSCILLSWCALSCLILSWLVCYCRVQSCLFVSFRVLFLLATWLRLFRTCIVLHTVVVQQPF